MQSEFEAQGFHASFKGLTATGRAQINPNDISFSSNLGSFSLPIEGLMLRTGGHHNQLFLEHPKSPGSSIVPQDAAILRHPLFAQNPAFASQLRQARKSASGGKGLLVALAVLLALALGLVVVGLSQRKALIRAAANQIPQSWEVKFGDTIFDQIKTQEKVVEEPEFEAVLKDISARLLPSIPHGGYSFQFHIVSDTNINAFAIPGGHVVIYTGLLKSAKTSEEVAGVLAHEIAHVTQKHAFRKIIESAGLFLIVQAMLGDASGLLAVIGDSSRFLLEQKFSRDFEREADDVGWEYLAAARVNPHGMIDFFKTLREQEMKSGLAMPALLATHPATEERISRLEEKWSQSKGVGAYTPLQSLPAKR